MVMFESIEELFQEWRGFNDYTRALVTLATAVGTLFIVFYFLKLCYASLTGLRLYVFSQFCCKTDYRKKYGQWAVISGSTDGIGLSMAKELAKRGMSIVVIGRNEEKLARTKVSLEEEENVGEVVTVKIDLSDSSLENFESIRDQIDPENREIGILINNAGVFEPKIARFTHSDVDLLRNMVNINVLATVYLTRMILPGMLERQKGLVINVSSILGQIPAPYMGVYGPTKSFIDSFSRTLQIEYSSHPIDIINLTPGAVYTKLFIQTSKIPKPTLLNPSPDDYARSAINAVSTRINSISGTMVHEFTLIMSRFAGSLGLLPMLFRLSMKLNARDVQLSPVTKRKVSQSPENNET